MIICGPLLRQCSLERVYIWFCTTVPTELHCQAYARSVAPRNTRESDAYSQVGIGRTMLEVQIGKSCYVQLIDIPATTPNGFPLETPIYYNISRSAAQNLQTDTVDLPEWGIPADVPIETISWNVSDTLPAFVVPAPAGNLDILFSSCRKPHGLGEDPLERWYSGGAPARPNLNLLIGDQIYADDVATQLLREIRRFAGQYVGEDGIEPKLIGAENLDSISDRSRAVKSGGITSDQCKNHLIAFGEFVMMYVFVFGTVRFRDQFRFSRPQVRSVFDVKDMEEFEALEKAKAYYDLLARLMANCPTYMIFDDHEVSDDWNISSRWKPGPLAKKYIVPNALGTYIMFQAWGNDPTNDNWSGRALDAIRDSFADFVGRLGTKQATPLDLDTSGWRWQYTVPTGHRLVVLDTRTKREKVGVAKIRQLQYPVGGKMVAASDSWITYSSYTDMVLASRNSIADILMDGRGPLLMVSATPVFGNSVIQAAQRLKANPSPLISDDEDQTKNNAIEFDFVIDQDFEDWCSHPESIIRLLDILIASGTTSVVVLSGDIHAGYICSGIVRYKGATLHFTQLVASAARNAPRTQLVIGAEVGQLMGLIPRGAENTFIWSGANSEYILADDARLDATKRKAKRGPDLEILVSRSDNELFLKNNVGVLTVKRGGIEGGLKSGGKLARATVSDFR